MIDFDYFYDEDQPAYTSTIKTNNIDIVYILRKLKKVWEEKDIPLDIDIVDSKVRISHKYPDHVEDSAQLRLHPNLAFILGYNEERTDYGQYLRFDQQAEYIAPYYPKSSMKDEQLYLMDLMLMIEERFEKNVQKIRQIIDDCLDREKKGITSIAHFEKVKHRETWILKATVLGGDQIDLGTDGYIQRVNIKDHSGEIELSAFAKQGTLLHEIASEGKEYYIERIYEWEDESDYYYGKMNEEVTDGNIIVQINGASYKVQFNEV